MTKNQEALPQPADEQYLFFDTRPNSDDPIKVETFTELCSVIEDIQQRLGVDNTTHVSIVSQGDEAFDSVHLDIGEDSIGSWILGVDVSTKKHLLNITIRNDAGTVESPWQIGAGSVTKEVGIKSKVVDRQFSLNDQTVKELTGMVRERDSDYPFVSEPIFRA